MKKYYKIFITLILVSFIVPQIAFASWWNPFSWKIFSIFRKNQTIIIAPVNKPISQFSEQQGNQEQGQIQKIADGNSGTKQNETQQESDKNKTEIERLKLIEENKKLKAEQEKQTIAEQQRQQELQQIKTVQQQIEAQKQKAEQDRLNLLAEQVRQKQAQELADRQAEQARLAKIELDKAQLQSILSSQLSSFNQQVSDIKSQLSSKKAEMDAIKAQYTPRIELEKTRQASMSIIMARVAKLTDEMNAELQPLINEYNALVNKYNILIGAPLEIQTQSSTIPQYLKFYPDGNGGGDLYGNGGSYHLKVEQTSWGFKIY